MKMAGFHSWPAVAAEHSWKRMRQLFQTFCFFFSYGNTSEVVDPNQVKSLLCCVQGYVQFHGRSSRQSNNDLDQLKQLDPVSTTD